MPAVSDFLSVDFLTSFAGAVLVTNIITHFIKDYTSDSIDNKIITLFVSFAIIFSNQFIFGTISLETAYVSFLNSFIVAAASMGNYEILTNKMKKREINELKLLQMGSTEFIAEDDLEN